MHLLIKHSCCVSFTQDEVITEISSDIKEMRQDCGCPEEKNRKMDQVLPLLDDVCRYMSPKGPCMDQRCPETVQMRNTGAIPKAYLDPQRTPGPVLCNTGHRNVTWIDNASTDEKKHGEYVVPRKAATKRWSNIKKTHVDESKLQLKKPYGALLLQEEEAYQEYVGCQPCGGSCWVSAGRGWGV